MKKSPLDNTEAQTTRQPEENEPLIQLMVPESAPADNSLDDSDEKELDGKTARRKLMESFTDDEGEKSDINFFYILRGDILTAKWLRTHILWLVMLVVLAFLYVSNRYYAQEQMIHNNKLKNELKEVHYNAMARSSELMRNCRRSTIMEQLATDPENTLAPSTKQPAEVEEEN